VECTTVCQITQIWINFRHLFSSCFSLNGLVTVQIERVTLLSPSVIATLNLFVPSLHSLLSNFTRFLLQQNFSFSSLLSCLYMQLLFAPLNRIMFAYLLLYNTIVPSYVLPLLGCDEPSRHVLILVTSSTKSTTFLDITPCRPLKVNRPFRGTCRLHLQGTRISREGNKRESRWQAKLPALTLVFCSVYSCTLKMEATYSSKTSVGFQRTTRRYIPENRTLRNYRCENLEFFIYQDTFLNNSGQ
jgi:hypothetical protein